MWVDGAEGGMDGLVREEDGSEAQKEMWDIVYRAKALVHFKKPPFQI